MATENSTPDRQPGMGRTLREDLERGDFQKSIGRDFRELKQFMLDEDRQGRLRDMNLFSRFFHSAGWLLKSLFFKLTPARRLLAVVGTVFILLPSAGKGADQNLHLVGGLVLLFLLMLELKDKLVARSELESGHAVQEALLPPRSPSIPGWEIWLYSRPAKEVGGDLMDFMKTGDATFGVAVGDVAGKGLQAALLSAKLQASLRALVTECPSLDSLATRLNLIFCRDSLPNFFASLVYLEVRPDADAVRLLNAGHIPPLLIKGNSVSPLARGGMALGLSEGATFNEQQLDMRAGEMLLIYSDGLTEARDEAGGFYGDERLLSLVSGHGGISAPQMGELLVAELSRFTGEAARHDDLSIAIIRRAR